MRIFVLGATGFIGNAVARQLLAGGHRVTGLARSDAAAAQLEVVGIEPHLGDLEGGLDRVVSAAGAFDGVVFAPQLLLEPEHVAVGAFLDAMQGSGKRFVFTSGTGVVGQRTFGAWSQDSFAEDDPFVPAKPLIRRVETETLVRRAADRGVRSFVIRPPVIWGPGCRGHVALTYQSVGATGAACYIGAGLNFYSNVHIEDLARLYVLVLERGTPGALYHAVAGEVPNRWIAEAVAHDLGVPTRSVTPEEAFEIWDKFTTLIVLGASSRTRCPRSRDELGWEPTRHDMLDLIGEPRLRALAGRGG